MVRVSRRILIKACELIRIVILIRRGLSVSVVYKLIYLTACGIGIFISERFRSVLSIPYFFKHFKLIVYVFHYKAVAIGYLIKLSVVGIIRIRSKCIAVA